MNDWLQGAILSITLLGGFAMGWAFGKLTGLRSPHLVVSALILVAGSLCGPLVGVRWLGREMTGYVVALALAGFAAGFVFWPMGEKQGEKEWL